MPGCKLKFQWFIPGWRSTSSDWIQWAESPSKPGIPKLYSLKTSRRIPTSLWFLKIISNLRHKAVRHIHLCIFRLLRYNWQFDYLQNVSQAMGREIRRGRKKIMSHLSQLVQEITRKEPRFRPLLPEHSRLTILTLIPNLRSNWL